MSFRYTSHSSCFGYPLGLICIFTFMFFMTAFSYADNCGGAIQCFCADRLTKSQDMWYDIEDCSDIGLIIGVDNITLNGNGHIIEGNPESGTFPGIYLENREEVSITNCKVSGFFDGIHLEGSANNNIENNLTSENDNHGIYVYRGSGNNILGNTAKGNTIGIELYSSPQNTITQNAANHNDNGIVLYDSPQNIVTENIANHNTEQGIVLSHNSSENIVSSNITIANESHGISLYGGSINNTVSENISKSNEYNGIILNHASFNTISDNIIKFNGYDGISLQTRGCEVSGNILESNQYGAHLSNTDITDFWDNIFLNNETNAYEDAPSQDNNWSVEEQGNWWSDFSSNPGYPDYYEIPGEGEGIDWYPSGN